MDVVPAGVRHAVAFGLPLDPGGLLYRERVEFGAEADGGAVWPQSRPGAGLGDWVQSSQSIAPVRRSRVGASLPLRRGSTWIARRNAAASGNTASMPSVSALSNSAVMLANTSGRGE